MVDTRRPPGPCSAHPTTWRPRARMGGSRPQARRRNHVQARPQASRPQEERGQPRQAAQHLSRSVGTPSSDGQVVRSIRVLRTSTVVVVIPPGPDSTVTAACSSTATRICCRSRSFSPGGALSPPHLVASSFFSFSSRPYSARHGRALVEVLGQQRPAALVALVVEEQPDLGQHLGAVGVVVIPAAHDGDLLLAAQEPAVAGGVGEHVPQLPTAPVQPRHHGADRRTHDLGDLLVGEPLDVGEVHGHPEVLRQLLQRRLHVVVRQPVQRLHLGRAQALRGVLAGLRDLPVGDLLGGRLLGLALPLAVAVDVGVGEDPVEPGLQVGAGPERAERGVGLEEGLLHQVLGVGRVAGHPQRGPVELVDQRHRVPLEAGGALLPGSRPPRRAGALGCAVPVVLDLLVSGVPSAGTAAVVVGRLGRLLGAGHRAPLPPGRAGRDLGDGRRCGGPSRG